MGLQAGDLRDRIHILTLKWDEARTACSWVDKTLRWAQAVPDTRNNLFSSVGIGARGVTFTIRAMPGLDLHHAFLWRGRHCFLTSILPVEEADGYWAVKAALVDVVECTSESKTQAGIRFPGVLTEKYVGHDQPDFHSEVTTDYVLVTPKSVSLPSGSWVMADGQYYKVLVPHLLDPYKNEFEIRRREDC